MGKTGILSIFQNLRELIAQGEESAQELINNSYRKERKKKPGFDLFGARSVAAVITDQGLEAEAFITILRETKAKEDLDSAVAAANGIVTLYQKELAKIMIIKALVRINAFFEEAKKLLDEITNSQLRDEARAAFVKSLVAVSNFEGARALRNKIRGGYWFVDASLAIYDVSGDSADKKAALDAAKTIADKYYKEKAKVRIVQSML